MRKSVVVVFAAGALVMSSLAFAAPKVLSSAQMETVAAGSLLDVFLPTTATFSTSGYEATETVEGLAAADNGGVAVSGSENDLPTAVATDYGIATNGDDNEVVADGANLVVFAEGGEEGLAAVGEGNLVTAIEQEGANIGVVTGDNAQIDVALNTVDEVDGGSAGVAGSGNTVDVFKKDITIDEAVISGGAYGVIAGEATVSNSFNVKEVEILTTITITDSFNVVTNSLDISGQDELQAIVNANTLGEQNIGVLLNVTTATANSDSNDVPEVPMSALATTEIRQLVLNASDVRSPLFDR